ncbi:hypothetical protein [Nesterenkonia pannonica]|uniref:hypothetical protein n=1 Tax=Nesterenkonia pannonica TaxID=1548602 RepID=UPI0021647DC4|nr:hypothetical protein [Nesterenkonia pannonica]
MDLLAAADRGLSIADMKAVLGVTPVTEGLQDCPLVASRMGRFDLRYGVVRAALRRLIPPERLAAHHSALAEINEPSRSFLHLAQAAQLNGEETEGLIPQLLDAAADSVASGERRGALELTSATCEIVESPAALESFARAALRAKRSRRLRQIASAADRLPPGVLRSALRARLHLDAGRFDAAQFELNRVTDFSGASTEATLLFGEVVCMLARVQAALGDFSVMHGLFRIVLAQLAVTERGLSEGRQ